MTPPPRWCTDNGVMVAWAGAERLALGLAEEPPAPWLGGGEGGARASGARGGRCRCCRGGRWAAATTARRGRRRARRNAGWRRR